MAKKKSIVEKLKNAIKTDIEKKLKQYIGQPFVETSIDQLIEASYIYAPYVPLQVTTIIFEEDMFPIRINDVPNINKIKLTHSSSKDDRVIRHWFGKDCYMLADGKYTFDKITKYYKKGLLHREDGPAIIHHNSNQYYWLYGKLLTLEQFYKKVKDTEHAPKIMAQILGSKANEE